MHIDSPRIPTVRPSTVSVEEVQDSEPAHLSTRTPQVQEPDDGKPGHADAFPAAACLRYSELHAMLLAHHILLCLQNPLIVSGSLPDSKLPHTP